ncbi:MAG: DUF5050 domain-containing protein [Clostridia bacterium]|nr:DUF5050 domain-containing protein [Clostridia bacterium]
MKKIIAFLCVAMLLISLCACTPKLEGGQPDGEIKSNGGIAVQQGDWIYFINGSMPELAKDALSVTEQAAIYRMNTLDGSVEQVTSEKAFNMYVYGDKIFYTTPSSTNVHLKCVGIDAQGSKRLLTFDDSEFITYGEKGVAVATVGEIIYFDYETLTKKTFTSGTVTGMRLSQSYVYYYDQTKVGLKRINIETGIEETLCDENGMILYVDDTEAYFISVRVPYKLNANTLELTQISEALYKNLQLNYANRTIICLESDAETVGIFSQPIDNVAGQPVGEGGNKARLKLHTKEISAYCVDDNFIYFVEAETGDVYRMTYEGTDKTVLGKVDSVYSVDSMDVVGNMLFIHDSLESGKAYFVKTDGSGSLTVAVKTIEEEK